MRKMGGTRRAPRVRGDTGAPHFIKESKSTKAGGGEQDWERKAKGGNRFLNKELKEKKQRGRGGSGKPGVQNLSLETRKGNQEYEKGRTDKTFPARKERRIR